MNDTAKCDICSREIPDPINPCKDKLVCKACYDRIIKERGGGKKAFTIKDIEGMFSTKPRQTSLMDAIR